LLPLNGVSKEPGDGPETGSAQVDVAQVSRIHDISRTFDQFIIRTQGN